jgi:hypothetical protein
MCLFSITINGDYDLVYYNFRNKVVIWPLALVLNDYMTICIHPEVVGNRK